MANANELAVRTFLKAVPCMFGADSRIGVIATGVDNRVPRYLVRLRCLRDST